MKRERNHPGVRPSAFTASTSSDVGGSRFLLAAVIGMRARLFTAAAIDRNDDGLRGRRNRARRKS
jgi:hypothetical protein